MYGSALRFFLIQGVLYFNLILACSSEFLVFPFETLFKKNNFIKNEKNERISLIQKQVKT